MNTETIIEKFAEQEIAFDLFKGDLMVNATEMAKPFKRRLDNFLVNQQTKDLIQALISDKKSDSNYLESQVIENQILVQKRGGHGGTYMCEDLALAFAMWLSPEFHVWILKMVREIIFGNNPELVREAVMNMPRIQKELDRLRRKRNRLRNFLLGDDRRKELSALINERAEANRRINSLSSFAGNENLYKDPEKLGLELMNAVMKRDTLDQQIREKETGFEKILITEEYLDLHREILQLPRVQRPLGHLKPAQKAGLGPLEAYGF